jgi:hypothetical protein
LKKINSNEAYVRDCGGVAHPLTDGGSYTCNANNYPTEFNVDPTEWSKLVRSVGSAAACPPAGTSRQLTSPSTDNYMLRKADGSAWLISKGVHTPVFPSSFNCFAERYLVWDLITDADLNKTAPDPVNAAIGCG